jgi:predicted RNase H-like HicB family nuclease
MRYVIVIEQTGGNYSAYAPDVPGCVATGTTIEEVQQALQEALIFHLEGLREEGLPIPQPSTVAYVDVVS